MKVAIGRYGRLLVILYLVSTGKFATALTTVYTAPSAASNTILTARMSTVVGAFALATRKTILRTTILTIGITTAWSLFGCSYNARNI